MIFNSDQEVVDLIKTNPSKALLDACRLDSKELRMLINGDGLTEYLSSIPEFERDDLKKLRVKLTRSIVDLYERILSQRDKVFTAKGGSKNYDLPEAQASELRSELNDIRKGLSIEKWVEKVALGAYDVDPMSVTFIEIDSLSGRAYPTYKSTDSIYEFKLNGRELEYIIFSLNVSEVKRLKLDSKLKYYRVIDDISDKIYSREGEAVIPVAGLSYPNYFGKVPARINSDEYQFTNDWYVSSINKIKELSKDFLEDTSTKVIAKKFQMYPKEWGVIIQCVRCEGEGKINGGECPSCGGTGEKRNIRVSERIGIPVDESGAPKVPTPPGGYFVPPIESWKAMDQELDKLEAQMQATYWGAVSISQTNGLRINQDGNRPAQTTATTSLLNEQAKHDRLKSFSLWAQDMEKFITDSCAEIMFPGSFKGSTIIYGDRYLLESPDELLDKYEGLRSKGAPIPALDSALIDVYEAKFAGNPIQLRKHMILMYVEPFVHFNVDRVLSMPIPDTIKQNKIFFSEWLQTKTDIQIVAGNEEALRLDLSKYASQYSIVLDEQISN